MANSASSSPGSGRVRNAKPSNLSVLRLEAVVARTSVPLVDDRVVVGPTVVSSGGDVGASASVGVPCAGNGVRNAHDAAP